MTTPHRIQRKRSKGWRMPDGAVYVGRGSKWGNPFIVDERASVTNSRIAVVSFREHLKKHGEWSPVPCRKWPYQAIPTEWTTVEDVVRELRGKVLACWCPIDRECHADVLLEIANA